MNYFLIAANGIMAIAFGIAYRQIPPQVPLFYSRPNGDAQLVTWWMIGIIPLLMNGLVLINRYIGKKFFLGNVFALNVLYYFNIFVIISFLIIFLKIIFLIT